MGACQNKDCTALGIVREMNYETTVPQGLDIASTKLETCFSAVCDTARIAASPNSNVSGLHCEDLDTHTPNFPTKCTFVESGRKLTLTTNTVYGGHAGSDRLVLTAVASSGARTELLRGSVSYEDTTDDAARGACTQAWNGTFTKE
jgi:hypothetical protein